MAHDAGPALGMSVGATVLAAVTADRAVTRSPILTLYPGRPSQVGFPGDLLTGAGTAAADTGLSVTDFVGRIGDPDPVVAADGSAHPAEQLLADALQALAHVITGGDPLPPAVAVAYPARWSTKAVKALRGALNRVPKWSENPVSLISDVTAVLTALQANPGLPDSGIIAVCDFGGSGTDITLVDAGADNRTIGDTVRHTGFSGQVIDQLLLDHVVAELGAGGSGAEAPAIGSPTRLRSQCSSVKERLSVETVAELPGFHAGVWITRVELDEAIREPLDGLLAAVQKTLDDNHIPQSDLSAVVSVGGVASIPAVNNALAERFRVDVISPPRPHLTAAIGAALAVAGDEVLAAAEPEAEAAQEPEIEAEAAEVEATEEPEVEAAAAEPAVSEFAPTLPLVEPIVPPDTSMPEASESTPDLVAEPAAAATAPLRTGAGAAPGRTDGSWVRRPVPVIFGAALVALLMGIVAVIALRHAADHEPESPPMTTESTTTTTEAPIPATPRPLPIPGQGPIFPETPAAPAGPEFVPPAPETTETAVAP